MTPGNVRKILPAQHRCERKEGKKETKGNQAFKSTDVHLVWMKAQISRNTLVRADALLQAGTKIKQLSLRIFRNINLTLISWVFATVTWDAG